MGGVVIGATVYKSKAAALRYFKAMLARYAAGCPVTAAEDEADLRALLDRHPEADQKIGCGVASFSVEAAAFGTRCFYLRRVDGTSTDFSYRSCVSAQGPSMLQQFYSAARALVTPSLLDAKRRYFACHGGRRAPCQVTGRLLDIEHAHADHRPPHTFKAICDAFLAEEGLVPGYSWLSRPQDNQHSTTITRPDVALRFQRFHDARADVQIIEDRLNLSYGARPRQRQS